MATVVEHYGSERSLQLVRSALEELAPDGRRVTFEELSGFDHFHTAGVLATARMAELLAPAEGDTVLDAGAGIGGPARFLADQFGCRVIGIDLTETFVDVGRLLDERTGMDELVELRVGDVTRLELADASVDHAWTQHAAMNIADRPKLYREIRRVMKDGGRFALFDVIDGGGGELLLPVPWATEPSQNHLVTRDELRELLDDAGFRIELDEDPSAELLPLMEQMLNTPPPETGLTMAMFIEDIEHKAPNYLRNLSEGRTSLALMLCTAV